MVDLNASVQDAVAGAGAAGRRCCSNRPSATAPSRHYVVKREVELSGENLTDAQPSFQDNQPVVSFRLDNQGARKFGRITQENVGKPFAIVLDDKVISAPNIREPILGGSGIISGNFTVESANELSVLLRAGALPAPLNVVEERSVGAELGADFDPCRHHRLHRGGGLGRRVDAGLLRHLRRHRRHRPGAQRRADPRHHVDAGGDAHPAGHRRDRAHDRPVGGLQRPDLRAHPRGARVPAGRRCPRSTPASPRRCARSSTPT